MAAKKESICIGDLMESIDELVDEGHGFGEIFEDLLHDIPKTHLATFKERIDRMQPEHEFEVTLQVRLMTQKHDPDTADFAAQITKDFVESPLSVEEWFRLHIYDYNRYF